MTDILPASVLNLAAHASKCTDEVISLIMSQNGGSSSRYIDFEPLGDDVVEMLAEEDIAFRRFADQTEMTATLEQLADTIKNGSPVSAEVFSFHKGELIDTSEFNMG